MNHPSSLPHQDPFSSSEPVQDDSLTGGRLRDLITSHRVQFGITIDDDRARYRDIARGRIRKDLGKFISQDEIIAQKGKDTIKIPLPRIDNPHFETQSGDGQGVGQGDGQPGDSLGKGQPKEGQGDRGAGSGSGDHVLEEVTIEELADMLGESLNLPNIEPKGSQNIPSSKGRYNTISRTGPPGLRHPGRTLKQALKRSITSGDYDFENPVIIPEREDFRYKDFNPDPKPQFNACIVYVMDVSGSMNAGQKEIARKVSFWIDLWLKRQYDNVERVFIIHDDQAKQVSEEEFFTSSATGGTKISSAYKEVTSVMERYPESDWNMYMFQFSDGDNFPPADNVTCVDMLRNTIVPRFNQVAYGQIPSQYGGTHWTDSTKGFFATLGGNFKDSDNVVLAPISDETRILEAIRRFFSGGR